ncbi:GNAT family N-acetyltransferase [Chitinimonas naiadis]
MPDRHWATPVHLRPWRPEDSAAMLTGVLHRAFAPLAGMGLHCASAHQDANATASRLNKGQAFVAIADRQLVGTLTIYQPQEDSEAFHYRQPGVASIHQFAVEPAWQGKGVGDALLKLAERWARSHDCHRLALDTPQPARHLLAFYLRKGFELVESLHFSGRGYHSVVLSKPLVAT